MERTSMLTTEKVENTDGSKNCWYREQNLNPSTCIGHEDRWKAEQGGMGFYEYYTVVAGNIPLLAAPGTSEALVE
eukprot:1778060-Amphidinium_carterae.1